ncbi:ScbA/BarX family gamma-butyrolactone biosynthesis protein [Streptomyces sp. NPDC056796]|uniref:ScbA/BarX family gamma-butyrolactone biosynthesis protein n=1 Tax=Streptomyces sp. NPDC056796 TaxID=3345947 RepID=UPI0036808370
MTVSESIPAPRAAADPGILEFYRTIDRRMVHRASVAEVFVTGLQETAELSFRCAAQLPVSHAYFNDHTGSPAPDDPLLLLEICRQASIYGAHRQLGVPLATTFMVGDWSIRLCGTDGPATGDRPGELILSETMTPAYDRRKRLTAVRFDIGLTMWGRPLGSAHIRVSSAPTPQYAALRHMQRGSTPPTTSAFRAVDDRHDAVAPARVGRLDPANVVLAGAGTRVDEETLSATLAPDFGNGGLFDHDYDHIPAMVLMEAARQSAILLERELRPDDGTSGLASVAALDASFSRFAELDSPVRVSAAPDRREGLPRRLSVSLGQSGSPVAAIGVTLRPPTPL